MMFEAYRHRGASLGEVKAAKGWQLAAAGQWQDECISNSRKLPPTALARSHLDLATLLTTREQILAKRTWVVLPAY